MFHVLHCPARNRLHDVAIALLKGLTADSRWNAFLNAIAKTR